MKQNNIRNGQQVNIAGQEFEAVSSFCYLGSTIPTDNSLDIEVRTRLLKANRAYFSLIRLFRSKTLKISTKLLLYRTMVLPVLMYSSETWALSQKQGESIAAFERKILRRIFGPVHEVGRFRSLYNHEVYYIYAREYFRPKDRRFWAEMLQLSLLILTNEEKARCNRPLPFQNNNRKEGHGERQKIIILMRDC